MSSRANLCERIYAKEIMRKNLCDRHPSPLILPYNTIQIRLNIDFHCRNSTMCSTLPRCPPSSTPPRKPPRLIPSVFLPSSCAIPAAPRAAEGRHEGPRYGVCENWGHSAWLAAKINFPPLWGLRKGGPLCRASCENNFFPVMGSAKRWAARYKERKKVS